MPGAVRETALFAVRPNKCRRLQRMERALALGWVRAACGVPFSKAVRRLSGNFGCERASAMIRPGH